MNKGYFIKNLEKRIEKLENELSDFRKIDKKNAMFFDLKEVNHKIIECANITGREVDVKNIIHGSIQTRSLYAQHQNLKINQRESQCVRADDSRDYHQSSMVQFTHSQCQTLYRKTFGLLRKPSQYDNFNPDGQATDGFAGIIGTSREMREIFKAIQVIASLNIPMLISGDVGTGKELLARVIHHNSSLRQNPLLILDCGECNEQQLEKELFGFKRCLSGENSMEIKEGKLALANSGTLILKKIETVSKKIQEKIFQFIQEGTFSFFNDDEIVSADTRIICTSEQDLQMMLTPGSFMRELYNKISLIPISLPPLRKRKEDIPLLIRYFLSQTYYNGKNTIDISQGVTDTLAEYEWPENVLELQSVIQYAVIKSKGETIKIQHLPYEIRTFQEEIKVKQYSIGRPCKLDMKSVKNALTCSGGNKAKAARILGVGRATLYNFLANYPTVYHSLVQSVSTQ